MFLNNFPVLSDSYWCVPNLSYTVQFSRVCVMK